MRKEILSKGSSAEDGPTDVRGRKTYILWDIDFKSLVREKLHFDMAVSKMIPDRFVMNDERTMSR